MTYKAIALVSLSVSVSVSSQNRSYFPIVRVGRILGGDGVSGVASGDGGGVCFLGLFRLKLLITLSWLPVVESESELLSSRMSALALDGKYTLFLIHFLTILVVSAISNSVRTSSLET